MNNTSKKRTVAGILCLGLLFQTAANIPAKADNNGKVTINEVCAKNTVFQSADGGCYDWIELYNGNKTEADISGWGLSDTDAEPYKYVFPNGTRIPAEGRILVFCDSNAAQNNSSIAPFGLSASGETLVLTDANGGTANTVTFGLLSADTSYGQYPDGSGQYYNLDCTPANANSAPEGSAAVHQPVFSQESGFYNSSFSLTLTADEGCKVYYTTDGSDPTEHSTEYTGPITINDMSDTENRLSARTDIVPDRAEAPSEKVDKAAIIRAVSVDSSGRMSSPVTKTYFIGKTNSGYYKNMNVVSLVTDPDNLFDRDKGIYCLGKVYEENRGGGGMPWEVRANYSMKGREWERPATFTLFAGGEKVVDENVGIRIKGNYSRSIEQKSFNIYTREEYGVSEFDYDFFSGKAVKAKNGKAIKKFDGLVLRNGGNDNSSAFFRDTINQELIADRAFAHQATTECIVFIDGEFWGIYQMMEKINKSFLSSHYGVKSGDIAMIENGALEEGSDSDLNDWRQLCSSVAGGGVSFDEFCRKVDLQGFMDYFAAQIYWANADWPQNNYTLWRCNAIDETNPYADGKWRMVLFDTESGQGLYGSEDKSFSSDGFRRIRQNNSQLAQLFNGMLSNEQFRLAFARTMMDLANHNFATDRTNAVISYYRNTFKQQVTDTFARFHSRSLSGGNAERRFVDSMSTVAEFYAKRYSYAERSLRSAMKLSSEPHKLTVVNNASNGSIDVNTLRLGEISSWSGNYHSDYDVTLTATPAEGREFSHWNISGATITGGDAKSATVKVKLSSDATVKAVYITDSDANEEPQSQPATQPQTTTQPQPQQPTKPQEDVPGKNNDNRSAVRTNGMVIQAENYDFNSGTDNENCSEGGLDAAYIENNDYIGFRDIDLTGVRNIDFRIGSNGARAALEIRIDDPNGQVIGRMDVRSSGGWQTWNTQTCSISEVNGRHNVYFRFTGDEGYLFNINWWRPDGQKNKMIAGDLNEDGVINVYDLCLMKSAVADGNADAFGAADIDMDDDIDTNDFELLNKFIMCEIKSF